MTNSATKSSAVKNSQCETEPHQQTVGSVNDKESKREQTRIRSLNGVVRRTSLKTTRKDVTCKDMKDSPQNFANLLACFGSICESAQSLRNSSRTTTSGPVCSEGWRYQ